jgi:hypothetical protein
MIAVTLDRQVHPGLRSRTQIRSRGDEARRITGEYRQARGAGANHYFRWRPRRFGNLCSNCDRA